MHEIYVYSSGVLVPFALGDPCHELKFQTSQLEAGTTRVSIIIVRDSMLFMPSEHRVTAFALRS